MAVNMSVLVFWILIPCGLVGGYKSFRRTYCPHIQDFETFVSANPHSIPAQETNSDSPLHLYKLIQFFR
jgi:hypothetical protein